MAHEEEDYSHDYDHTEVDHDADGLDAVHPHDDNNPVEEGSKLHLEIHRAVDELGKYAIELDVQGDMPKAEVVAFVDDFMRTATAKCFDAGADLIGHIKGFVKYDGKMIMFSMVDPSRPTNVEDHMTTDTLGDYLAVVHIIVHGIWDDVIRECALDVLPGIAEKHGAKYKIRADFYDTEKSIAHHEKK